MVHAGSALFIKFNFAVPVNVDLPEQTIGFFYRFSDAKILQGLDHLKFGYGTILVLVKHIKNFSALLPLLIGEHELDDEVERGPPGHLYLTIFCYWNFIIRISILISINT